MTTQQLEILRRKCAAARDLCDEELNGTGNSVYSLNSKAHIRLRNGVFAEMLGRCVCPRWRDLYERERQR